MRKIYTPHKGLIVQVVPTSAERRPPLVIVASAGAYLRAVVVPVLAEEAALGERGGAGAAREAGRVEVLVGHAQHLAAALAAARAAHHLACDTENNNLSYLPVGIAYAVLYV